MKVYIAGKLGTTSELEMLEKIDVLCKELGLETFLPHRDVGIAKGIGDVQKVFKGDIIEGFKDISLVIVSLDGLHVGSGTAWELGYAYAKGIPLIGLKTDESVDEALAIAQDQLKVKESQRTRITPEIKPDILSRYERILNNKDGLAIVMVNDKNACSGCYMHLTEQRLNEIRKYDQLVSCDMCARIVYLADEL